MNFIFKEEVIDTLRKLEVENYGNIGVAMILNEAMTRIEKLTEFEQNHLACSILFAERERLKLTDDMIYNFEVEMKSGKKYKISCEVVE